MIMGRVVGDLKQFRISIERCFVTRGRVGDAPPGRDRSRPPPQVKRGEILFGTESEITILTIRSLPRAKGLFTSVPEGHLRSSL